MNNAGEFLEVFRLAGQLQNVDSAHRVPLLQTPTDPAIAREGVVSEVFPDEKPSTVVFAFGDLKYHSGVVGAVSVKTPEFPSGQDVQPGGHILSPLREAQGGCSGERCYRSEPWLVFRCDWRANSRWSPVFGYRELCSRPSFGLH